MFMQHITTRTVDFNVSLALCQDIARLQVVSDLRSSAPMVSLTSQKGETHGANDIQPFICVLFGSEKQPLAQSPYYMGKRPYFKGFRGSAGYTNSYKILWFLKPLA